MPNQLAIDVLEGRTAGGRQVVAPVVNEHLMRRPGASIRMAGRRPRPTCGSCPTRAGANPWRPSQSVNVASIVSRRAELAGLVDSR